MSPQSTIVLLRVLLFNDQSKVFHRGDYVRSGSYGINWQVVAPFPDLDLQYAADPDHAKLYPVHESAIVQASDTVVLGDAYGEFDGSSGSNGPHAYTLDPPKLIQARWGTGSGDLSLGESGVQTPADPRHRGDMANFLFADGHAASLTMTGAGYVADEPKDLQKAKNDVGEGSNKLWSGDGTE